MFNGVKTMAELTNSKHPAKLAFGDTNTATNGQEDRQKSEFKAPKR